MVVLCRTVHEGGHAFQSLLTAGKQMLFHHADVIEGVDFVALLYPRQSLFPTSQFAEHNSFHGPRLVVVGVANEAAFQFFQGIPIPLLSDADACGLEVPGIGPRFVPSGFPEELVCFADSRLVFQTERQVEDGFAIVGVGIAFLPDSNGTTQIVFGFVKASATQEPQSHLVQATHIVGVAAQSLLVVVESRPCGMSVLLQVKTREVQLVHRLAFHGWQGCFSAVGNRSNFVGFRVPLENAALATSEGFEDIEGKFRKRDFRTCYGLCKHLLWRQRHYLVIIAGTVITLQNDSCLLPRCSQHLEAHSSVCFLDIEDEILRGLLDDSEFTIGHEILRELLLFVRHQPREVGLVLGIDACHQFDVGAEA